MRCFIRAWAITAIAVLWPICVSAEVQDNDQVAHKIHDRLKASGRMSGSSFVIKCQDGTACLEGRVGSDEQKALALRLAGEVPEINEVLDRLRVEPAKKADNPVVRMLSKPFSKPVADDSEPAEQEVTTSSKRSTLSNWLQGPAVRVAKAPRPQAQPQELAADEVDVNSRETVYPESLEEAKPADSENALVRQAANLRQIFRRNGQPEQQAPVAVTQKPAPRPIAQTANCPCEACKGKVVRSSTTPHVAQVSNTKRRSSATRATNAPQAQPSQVGRVRMVPMIELADGSLVPVEQAKGASAASQPTPASKMSTASRRVVANRRSQQSVARKQELIDGPMDAAPAGPVPVGPANGGPLPSYVPGTAVGVAPAYYDQPHMPNYAWPSYAAHPNYAGLTYPRQYSPTAWPYIGPFYPYPQVPLGWRKVTLEWDDGWWFLDFDDCNRSYAN